MSADVRVKLSDTLKSANARVDAFYIHDGGEVTTRLTSNDPVELVSQLYRPINQWTATIRSQAKAYTVTLAPYVIATRSRPAECVQLEHQRDILIRCAKLRSQTLDKLNLVATSSTPTT